MFYGVKSWVKGKMQAAVMEFLENSNEDSISTSGSCMQSSDQKRKAIESSILISANKRLKIKKIPTKNIQK